MVEQRKTLLDRCVGGDYGDALGQAGDPPHPAFQTAIATAPAHNTRSGEKLRATRAKAKKN